MKVKKKTNISFALQGFLQDYPKTFPEMTCTKHTITLGSDMDSAFTTLVPAMTPLPYRGTLTVLSNQQNSYFMVIARSANFVSKLAELIFSVKDASFEIPVNIDIVTEIDTFGKIGVSVSISEHVVAHVSISSL